MPILFDAALAHADDAVGHGGRLDLIVGDENCRDTQAALQAADFTAHRQAESGVEI